MESTQIPAQASRPLSSRLAVTIPKVKFDLLKKVIHCKNRPSLITNVRGINFLNPQCQFIILIPDVFKIVKLPPDTSCPEPISLTHIIDNSSLKSELNSQSQQIVELPITRKRKQPFPAKLNLVSVQAEYPKEKRSS